LKNYGFNNLLLDVIANKIKDNNILDKDIFLNDDSFKTQPIRKVYNLLMGSGKTKVITPILLLYIYNYIKFNPSSFSKIIL
jgi:hypothetical protein